MDAKSPETLGIPGLLFLPNVGFINQGASAGS
jgi:hypothetical protein